MPSAVTTRCSTSSTVPCGALRTCSARSISTPVRTVAPVSSITRTTYGAVERASSALTPSSLAELTSRAGARWLSEADLDGERMD
eukprot:33357-Eustigmatos_ZCMA.PRE.1